MFLTCCSPSDSKRIGSLCFIWSMTVRETATPPGSASCCSLAAMLTPSPYRPGFEPNLGEFHLVSLLVPPFFLSQKILHYQLDIVLFRGRSGRTLSRSAQRRPPRNANCHTSCDDYDRRNNNQELLLRRRR